MDFKLNLALFKSTEESNKKYYGDKYDPSKNYPQYNGNIQLSEMDIIKLCTYLQKAKPKANDYHPEGVVTVKAVGYINKPFFDLFIYPTALTVTTPSG